VDGRVPGKALNLDLEPLDRVHLAYWGEKESKIGMRDIEAGGGGKY